MKSEVRSPKFEVRKPGGDPKAAPRPFETTRLLSSFLSNGADSRNGISARRGFFSGLLLACAFALCATISAVAGTNEAARPTLLLAVGAPGEPAYATNFIVQAETWRKTASQAGFEVFSLGLADPAQSTTNSETDYALLKARIQSEPTNSAAPLWLVLIGHGTFDNKEAKFNLRGPDLSATELAQWLKPFRRPLVIINTASSSSPFLNQLSGTNRVIITATRSGNEQNFTRFGQFLAQAICDPQSDLDKDGQVSLLEAFLVASRKVGEFYRVEGRLATEHALIDDNGDALGTPADWYRGVRATKKPEGKQAIDGRGAQNVQLLPSASERDLSPEQRAVRDRLEAAVFDLRDKKSQLPEDVYYNTLERLLLELANLQPP